MENQKKTERKVDDILMYCAEIDALLTGGPIVFNGVSISDQIRYTAIYNELHKLMLTIGITDKKYQDYNQNGDFSEDSPAAIEYRDCIEKAVSQVNEAINDDN